MYTLSYWESLALVLLVLFLSGNRITSDLVGIRRDNFTNIEIASCGRFQIIRLCGMGDQF